MFFKSVAPPLVPPADHLILPDIFLDDTFDHPTKLKGTETPLALINERTGHSVSLAELKEKTYCLANALKKGWKLGQGDIITLCLPNHLDYIVCVWAGHLLGCTIMPVNPSQTSDELVYQLEIARPSLIIAHPDNLELTLKAAEIIKLSNDQVLTIDTISEGISPVVSIPDLTRRGGPGLKFTHCKLGPGEAKKRIAFLCCSSGTTGKPKAVAISHYNVVCNLLQLATFNAINTNYTPMKEQRYRPGDVCTGVLPLYHIYGLMFNLHFGLYAKMTVVISPNFDFVSMLKSIEKYRITHLMIVPPQAVLLCKHSAAAKADLSSIRSCLVGAAPVSAELTGELLRRLPGIHLGQGYGMTEAGPALSMWPIAQKVGTLGSGGQLVSSTVAKIVKEDGTLGGYNEPGELYVQGVQVTLGYYKNEEATKDVYIDGWLRTGDIAFFGRNGDIFIIDRAKELIKVKGLQVAPAELEGHLLTHQDVADAAVIGVPDDYAGEVPLAFIVLKHEKAEGVTRSPSIGKEVRESIFKHVSSAKSQYKWLTGGIVFIDAIPKNPSGKILRRVLRERINASQSQTKSRL